MPSGRKLVQNSQSKALNSIWHSRSWLSPWNTSFNFRTPHHTLLWFFFCSLSLIFWFFLVAPNTNDRTKQDQLLEHLLSLEIISLDLNHAQSFKSHWYANNVLIYISTVDLFLECVLCTTSSLTFSLCDLISISTLICQKWNSWTPASLDYIFRSKHLFMFSLQWKYYFLNHFLNKYIIFYLNLLSQTIQD